MATIPSRQRSEKLISMANNVGLTDPYRILHPVKREFTYVPNARMNLNRSRIDFFLIKKELADRLIDCRILPALSSTSFDHKKIKLDLGKQFKYKDFNKIDTNLLKNRGLNLLVKIKVLESYIVHSDPDVVPRYQSRNWLIDIYRIERYIKNWVSNNDQLELIGEAEAIFETLPELEIFENLPRTGSDEFFFEGLVSIVRIAVLSLQSSIHKEKNKHISNLKTELINLKENYLTNFLQISEIERTLSAANEQDLKEELDNYKIFDRLNNEKITPYFMNLARAQNSGPDINVIRDDNGKVLTELELEQHVTGFYKNLYALPRENLNVTQDHLHNFLGPVADAEPVVQSKLNIAEKMN
jgi:hypothetical protein